MKTFAAAIGLGLAACTGASTMASGPVSVAALKLDGAPMVSITNSSASAAVIGVFATLHPPQPQPMGGVVTLGLIGPGATLCTALPAVTLVGTNLTTGRVDTIPGVMADTIMLTVFDTTTKSMRYTPTFVPKTAAGWAVSTSDPTLTATPASACTLTK